MYALASNTVILHLQIISLPELPSQLLTEIYQKKNNQKVQN